MTCQSMDIMGSGRLGRIVGRGMSRERGIIPLPSFDSDATPKTLRRPTHTNVRVIKLAGPQARVPTYAPPLCRGGDHTLDCYQHRTPMSDSARRMKEQYWVMTPMPVVALVSGREGYV
jgi:hypothetical protein